MIELGQLVIRFSRLIIISLVAGIAICRRAGILSGVTGDTGGLLVRAGQRKCGGIVIILGWHPRVDRVAERAIMSEPTGFVVRVTGGGKIRTMARIAIT